MYSPIVLIGLLTTPSASMLHLSALSGTAKHLNVSALTADSGKSVIECWQLSAPLTISTQRGTQGTMTGPLGDLANATWNLIPAGTDGGLHTAPNPQYVAFLTGSATVTIPGSAQRGLISGGKNGLFFVADTSAISQQGHYTYYVEETVLLQVPTANGLVPLHRVLYKGQCEGLELVN